MAPVTAACVRIYRMNRQPSAVGFIPAYRLALMAQTYAQYYVQANHLNTLSVGNSIQAGGSNPFRVPPPPYSNTHPHSYAGRGVSVFVNPRKGNN